MMGCTEIEIPDLEKKIEAVERENQHIRETDPYQYKYLLDDEEAVRERRRDLEERRESYVEYERELDEVIEGLLDSGIKVIWKMN